VLPIELFLWVVRPCTPPPATTLGMCVIMHDLGGACAHASSCFEPRTLGRAEIAEPCRAEPSRAEPRTQNRTRHPFPACVTSPCNPCRMGVARYAGYRAFAGYVASTSTADPLHVDAPGALRSVTSHVWIVRTYMPCRLNEGASLAPGLCCEQFR
jgi:hypothetical protein